MAEPKNFTIEFPNPDYNVIKQYITDGVINENYFQRNFKTIYSYDNTKYTKFIEFLTDENLLTDHNLYFFWVYFSDGYGYSKWQTDSEDFKIWKNYNQDLKKLKLFFKELEAEYDNREMDSINRDMLFSLTIKSNKREVTVKAHPLLHDIFFHLNKWVGNGRESKLSKEKSKLSYFRNFIKSTKPLFQYLHEKHYKDKPDIDIYSLISDFVQSIGYDWSGKSELDKQEYIRKCYSELPILGRQNLMKK